IDALDAVTCAGRWAFTRTPTIRIPSRPARPLALKGALQRRAPKRRRDFDQAAYLKAQTDSLGRVVRFGGTPILNGSADAESMAIPSTPHAPRPRPDGSQPDMSRAPKARADKLEALARAATAGDDVALQSLVTA